MNANRRKWLERGETMQENADELDSILTDLENVIDSINEIIEK